MHKDNKPECPEKKVRLSSHNPCFSRFFSSAESSLFSAAAFFIHIRRLPFKVHSKATQLQLLLQRTDFCQAEALETSLVVP